MEPITTTAELRSNILLLETEHKAMGDELKKQFFMTYREFKPFSLFANVLKEVLPSTNMVENIIIGGLSLASGYLVKKIVVGRSGGLGRKRAGSALQAGTSGLIARNTDVIKAIGHILFGVLTTQKKEKQK